MRVGRGFRSSVLWAVAGMSFLTAGGAADLWHRSWHVGDLIQWNRPTMSLGWYSSEGGVRLFVATATPPERLNGDGAWSWDEDHHGYPHEDKSVAVVAFPWAGISIDRCLNGVGGYWSDLILPYWVIVLLAGIPGGTAGWRLWRRRRPALSGVCRSCGYDLRASPGRCPECGTAPAVP